MNKLEKPSKDASITEMQRGKRMEETRSKMYKICGPPAKGTAYVGKE
jgi:hypothetical protein